MGSARLWDAAPAARGWLAGSIALGVGASTCGAALLIGVALVVAAVFGGSASAADVAPALVALVAIVAVRSVLIALAEGDGAAGRVAGHRGAAGARHGHAPVAPPGRGAGSPFR